jgi:hypothetical protein
MIGTHLALASVHRRGGLRRPVGESGAVARGVKNLSSTGGPGMRGGLARKSPYPLFQDEDIEIDDGRHEDLQDEDIEDDDDLNPGEIDDQARFDETDLDEPGRTELHR